MKIKVLTDYAKTLLTLVGTFYGAYAVITWFRGKPLDFWSVTPSSPFTLAMIAGLFVGLYRGVAKKHLKIKDQE